MKMKEKSQERQKAKIKKKILKADRVTEIFDQKQV